MSRPIVHPEFALNNVNDPISGKPNISEPSQSLKDSGWTRRQKPYRQHFNWLHKTTNDWIVWLDSLIDSNITAASTIIDQSLKTTDSPTFTGITTKGNIIPDMTGATGVVSVRYIGSETEYFKAIYTDELFLGASSLYVNNKKVIEDVSNEINISTDSDQGLRLKTTGSGIIYLDSEDEIDLVAEGGFDFSVPSTNPSKHFSITNASTNGNVSINANITNGQVQLLGSEVDLTATLIDINGDVNISGTLTMGATTLSTLLGSISGTTANLWGLDNDAGAYPQLKNDSGVLRIRNKDDNDDADLIVKNLTVNGTTTTVNSETLAIADNIMLLNSNITGTPTEDGGLEVERGTETNASLIWDEGSDFWKAGLTGSEVRLADINYQGVWDINGTSNYYNGGNVGINTDSPSEKLHVNGTCRIETNMSIGAVVPVSNGSNFNNLRIRGTVIMGETIASYFTNNSYYNDGWKPLSTAGGSLIYIDSNGVFKFSNAPSHATTHSFVERFRIDADGKVGIGTSEPSYKLTLNGGNASQYFGLENGYSGNGFLLGNDSLGGTTFYSRTSTNANAPYQFYTGTTERVRIAADGKVGIGTSSPGGALDVAYGGISMLIGADVDSFNRTNSTQKLSRIGGYHYTNSEEPFALITGVSGSTATEILIGGGTSVFNTATGILFYTAANNTTLTGTKRIEITSDGSVIVGSPTGGGKGSGTINAQAVYDDNTLLTKYALDYLIDSKSFDARNYKEEKLAVERFLGYAVMCKDIDKYNKYVTDNKVLPTFADIELRGIRPSVGELGQRCWEELEIKTVHIMQLHNEIKELKEEVRKLKRR